MQSQRETAPNPGSAPPPSSPPSADKLSPSQSQQGRELLQDPPVGKRGVRRESRETW